MKIIEIARQLTLLYPLFELIEKVKINYFLNKKEAPILIYQMGKVGSATVYETLKQLNIKNSIYHIHYLSNKRTDKAIKTYKSLKRSLVPMHLRRSRLLIDKIDLQKDKLKIITLTREPIARIFSEFFQNIAYFSPELINNKNKIDFEAALTKVKNRIENYDINNDEAATWFDKELKKALKIDVYNFSFPKEKGYQIIEKDNIECLIIKMEDLNIIGVQAIHEFLNIDKKIQLKQTNIGEKKVFSKEQKKMKKDLHFDKSTLKYIYSSKYMKHFYSDHEISSFILKNERNGSV